MHARAHHHQITQGQVHEALLHIFHHNERGDETPFHRCMGSSSLKSLTSPAEKLLLLGGSDLRRTDDKAQRSGSFNKCRPCTAGACEALRVQIFTADKLLQLNVSNDQCRIADKQNGAPS